MSMERVGQQAPGSRHHGREFWALALEVQRARGQTGAALQDGHLIHWIVRSVKPIKMDQAGNLFMIWPMMW